MNPKPFPKKHKGGGKIGHAVALNTLEDMWNNAEGENGIQIYQKAGKVRIALNQNAAGNGSSIGRIYYPGGYVDLGTPGATMKSLAYDPLATSVGAMFYYTTEVASASQSPTHIVIALSDISWALVLMRLGG